MILHSLRSPAHHFHAICYGTDSGQAQRPLAIQAFEIVTTDGSSCECANFAFRMQLKLLEIRA